MGLPTENGHYTYADCLTWDESKRIELICGKAHMMPTRNSAHQKIVGSLFCSFYDYFQGKKGEAFPGPFGVRLFEQDGDRPEDVDTVVEPDIVVICDPSKIDKAGCKGAPDMIVEVLSPSNHRHDRFTKFNLYQKAGVREYWIADPEEKSVQVFLLEDGRYSVKDYGVAGDKLRVNILEDCEIDLAPVFPE